MASICLFIFKSASDSSFGFGIGVVSKFTDQSDAFLGKSEYMDNWSKPLIAIFICCNTFSLSDSVLLTRNSCWTSFTIESRFLDGNLLGFDSYYAFINNFEILSMCPGRKLLYVWKKPKRKEKLLRVKNS